METLENEMMLPYVVIKFSNGDVVLGEFVEETFSAMVVRKAISIKKAYVTNEFGVKVEKKISSIYCDLAYRDEIVVQKPACNCIAPLKHENRKYYDVLVAYHYDKNKTPTFNDSDDKSIEEKQDESKEKSKESKPIIH